MEPTDPRVVSVAARDFYRAAVIATVPCQACGAAEHEKCFRWRSCNDHHPETDVYHGPGEQHTVPQAEVHDIRCLAYANRFNGEVR